MNQYVPVFPRSVSDGDYRMPLDHPCCEKIGQRLDAIYRSAPLSESERALILKVYRELQEADHRAFNWYAGAPLPTTDLRPEHWDIERGAHLQRTVLTAPQVKAGEYAAGWIWRAAEYIAGLERKYALAVGGGDERGDI